MIGHEPGTCRHAGSLRDVVRLWDGRDHCSACVEAACAGLVAYALGHETLEDAIPYDPEGGLRTWGKIAGLFFGSLTLVSLGFFAVLDPTSVLVLVGTMALCLGLGMVGSLPAVYRARHVLPSVRVRDGLVEVFRPDQRAGKFPSATFRLEEARWHVSKLQEDSRCQGRGGAIVPDQRVVILRSPRRWPGVVPPGEFTAVGSSPEMVRIWVGFLKLTGVPEGK